MTQHPVALLRRRLIAEFSSDLPEGVHPVTRFCAEPQFFPGATGLLSAATWSEVTPGVQDPVADEELPNPTVEVMVVGNYQATWASYQRILSGEIGGFPTTWRRLRLLLASIPPTAVFLTNAYVGLPDLAKDTAPFPTDPEFDRRCRRLLALEIELFRPHCVVCLGTRAAKMLASVADGLDAWRPWPGYEALRAQAAATIRSRLPVSDIRFTAVAVQHPSAVISTAARRVDSQLIASAVAGRRTSIRADSGWRPARPRPPDVRKIRITGRFLAGENETVGRMCWVAPELAGERHTTEVHGTVVTLWFAERTSLDISQEGYVGRMGDDPTSPLAVSPSHLFAELLWELERSDAAKERQGIAKAIEVLRGAVTRLTDGIRLAQPDSGLAGETPRALELTAVDTQTGEPISIGIPINRAAPKAIGYPVVDKARLARALAGDLDVPELLLAQAAYWTLWTADPKPGLGVVLLAMACEAKARRVLWDRVPKGMEPLLHVLFEKPRVFQHPASDLFDHIADAVIGRSFRVDKGQDLWKQLVRIFELRNLMAHRAAEPNRSEVGPLIDVGYKAFEWLSQAADPAAEQAE